jgi:membrane protein implicated in regulation of membrane protease activity
MGLGLGLVAGAAILSLFALGFGLAAAAAGIATATPLWAALLIVTGGLLLVTSVLALIGVARLREGTPPVPEQALEEARLTTEALKNGSR